jgi:hypothetical protein
MAPAQILSQFINITNPKDIGASSKDHSVRSHVARHQWKNYKRDGRGMKSRQQFLPIRIQYSVQPKDEPATEEESTSPIPRLLGGCRVDPFHSYPVWKAYLPPFG